MRIVAGRAGGRTLSVPDGSRTRPTSERVRESLFAVLDSRGLLAGARVLDLYAGSGALALEALSRGAAAATCVEADRRAAAVATRNAIGVGLSTTVARERVERWLTGPGAAVRRFDLVLADPPYDLSERELAGVLRSVVGVCAAGALVVVERSVRSPEPGWPPLLTSTECRRYGESALWFAELATPARGPADDITAEASGSAGDPAAR